MELPQLDKNEQHRIELHIRKVVAGKSHLQLIVFTVLLALENSRLAKEVNRLREAAGEPLMKTYNPGE